MKLLIVESPAKAKTISKYLGTGWKVLSSVGHIRDIPKSNKDAIDIEAGFVPHYITIPGKDKVVRELTDAAKKADEVLLATDPDREGEAIAWHIKELCKLKNPKRVVFHEITKPAIEEAVEHPRHIDDNLRRAQEARRVLDRLFGYDLSGLIWKKVRYGLSAGRVQSPALRILMEREREIRAFVPRDFWVLTADAQTAKKESLPLTCVEEAASQEEADRIVEKGTKATWQITDVKESDMKRSPRAPFITSTLQQAASTRLGFAPSRTMQLAQRLYEAGHITYMRTDSTNVSKQAQGEIIAEISKTFGKEYVAPRTYATKSKSAQEAHEAIRPTRISIHDMGANPEQKRLYKLIWQRAIASQMTDAQMKKTKVVAEAEGADIPAFAANGSRIVFDGWLLGDPQARGEDTILPEVAVGDTLSVRGILAEHKQTEPPNRYTEAGLVKELEKREIGRPSTYAATIKTLTDRTYVEKQGKTLIPTDLGEVVSTFIENNFADYVSDSFTAEMENELDEIAGGTRDYVKTLKEFYTPFTKALKAKEKIPKITDLGPAPEGTHCPVCGKSMIIKLGRGGKFLSCSTYPECTGALTIEGKEMAQPKETGLPCPTCGEKHDGKLIVREGRYGSFIGCNRYPKCKYIQADPEEEKKKMTDVQCPACKNGFMMARRGRFGEFYSCSNYPACKNAIKARPTGNLCPMCGALMMDGTKTIPERCSSKVCPNHNPHKLQKKEG